ncbi:hypothetical protein NDU88_006093 [Pleurodeles waltl]|uniref:Uncharacterized protein n=1 Tax=Pleurodeles waltl TaxID=8319 RepID=A0AAV7TVT8_PLEWA|nr:hypothetical protein NDU88_006093 [Pleurodeles waltl]
MSPGVRRVGRLGRPVHVCLSTHARADVPTALSAGGCFKARLHVVFPERSSFKGSHAHARDERPGCYWSNQLV